MLYNTPEVKTLISIKNITKIYPTHTIIIEFKKEYLQQQKGYEQTIKKEKQKRPKNEKMDSEDKESNFRSRRRTKTIIQDLVLSNDFQLFATFTFKEDRQDIEKCKKKMSTWLKNQQRIHGKFEYIIVPEFHKDKKSIHFHALLQNYKGKLTPAKLKKNPKKLHNITSYHLGHSTANIIKSKDKCSSYIRKYITKDMPQFDGKKRYWASKNLNRPEKIYNYPFRLNPFLEPIKVHEHKYFDVYRINATIKTYTPPIKKEELSPLSL